MLFLKTRFHRGIEITQDQIRAVLVVKDGDSWALDRSATTLLPQGTLKPSFKTENIIDPDGFSASLKQLLQECRIVKGDINISLPSGSTRVVVHALGGLPQEIQDKNEMIRWSVSRSLGFSLDGIRVSWDDMGTDARGNTVLLVALASESVLSQYETMIKKTGVVPRILLPTGLNQFNFYASALPDRGKIAYLGLFDSFITLFVFDDGVPCIYKNIKKGFLSMGAKNTVNDLDMVFHYCMNEYPDMKIEKVFIAPHSLSLDYMKKNMALERVEFEILSDQNELSLCRGSAMDQDKEALSSFVAAAGAAMAGAGSGFRHSREKQP